MKPRTAWLTCRCGKEYPLHERGSFRERTQAEQDQDWHWQQQIANMSLCTSCGYEVAIYMNSCPEYLVTDTGVSGCKLELHHTGRCEPHEFSAAFKQQLIAERKRQLGQQGQP